MTNYFSEAKTREELKATYKELVKKYHPDIYGEKGNEILKEIHQQLEKAVKRIDKGYFSNYADSDAAESDEVRRMKEELVKEAMQYAFPEGALFGLYWQHNLKPYNHRNPITKHNFQGWNVWALEIKMLLKGYNSCEWSTFAQYRQAKNNVKKGEHGTYITLAIVSKKKDEDDEEEKESVYYKGYSVFNVEQTHGGSNEEQPAQIGVNLMDIAKAKEPAQEVQKVLNLWQEKYEVVA